MERRRLGALVIYGKSEVRTAAGAVSGGVSAEKVSLTDDAFDCISDPKLDQSEAEGAL